MLNLSDNMRLVSRTYMLMFGVAVALWRRVQRFPFFGRLLALMFVIARVGLGVAERCAFHFHHKLMGHTVGVVGLEIRFSVRVLLQQLPQRLVLFVVRDG